jgi:hypothetical protein
VTLTAQIASEPPRDPEPAAAPEPESATEPAAEDEVEPVTAPVAAPDPARRRGFFARLFGRRPEPPPEAEPVEPVAVAPPAPAARADRSDAQEEPAAEPVRVAPQPPQPASLDAGRAEAILAGVLDDLGAARHRPFSRG